ncbi:MAG: hypothetical protein AABX11_06200 [Nanoarchaeota archaeon]
MVRSELWSIFESNLVEIDNRLKQGRGRVLLVEYRAGGEDLTVDLFEKGRINLETGDFIINRRQTEKNRRYTLRGVLPLEKIGEEIEPNSIGVGAGEYNFCISLGTTISANVLPTYSYSGRAYERQGFFLTGTSKKALEEGLAYVFEIGETWAFPKSSVLFRENHSHIILWAMRERELATRKSIM